jgi:hypothetical protein
MYIPPRKEIDKVRDVCRCTGRLRITRTPFPAHKEHSLSRSRRARKLNGGVGSRGLYAQQAYDVVNEAFYDIQ